MKLKHVGMIVVSVLAMSSAAVSAAEGDESVTTTVNGGVIHFKGVLLNLSIYPPLLRDARHHLVHIGSTFI
ncbi:hypothetical protein HI634_003412 [Escherichia coli]|nr:hypothetical protein [Escherichia coli]